MHNYVQSLSCRKLLIITILLGAAFFLFIYSDNTLNSYNYDEELLELGNFSYNTTEDYTEIKKRNKSNSLDNPSAKLSDKQKQWSSTIDNKINFTKNYNQRSETEIVGSYGVTTFSTSEEETTNQTPLKQWNNNTNQLLSLNEASKANDYLVWSPECKIPSFDPFDSQAMKYFQKKKYISCRKHKLLTYVKVEDNKARLYINETVLPSYTTEKITCCYSYVTRHGSKDKPDVGIRYSTCTPFEKSIKLTGNTVKISCKTLKKHKKIYENVHEVITVKENLKNLKIPHKSTRPPSVLFVGIDSISRLNLIRAMPKTYEFLTNRSETWMPLYGYNKIGDNTFPNLVAIFTGYNDTEAYKICNPKTIGPLDSCRFIWKDYKKFGYVTAYGEDESSINTFNYRKKGFVKEPVDHYFKPYMEAAEDLGVVKQHSLSFCAGPETSGERIMNLAKNFAKTYRNYASFGFFWMNTFSHNDLNTPGRMDEKVVELLKDITHDDILDNSIVIFLSDHGMRFGEIRHTFTGWLEERLPYIYFSFPKWFKEKHPQEIMNFQVNANRLTTPYDVHLTLQHILVLSGFNYSIRVLDTCPLCKSLFTPVGLNRSCETTGITPHWCTCGGYSKLDHKDQTVIKAAYYLIKEIQLLINKKGGSQKCAKYHLSKVLSSYISEKFTYKNDTYLLITVETFPKAVFESTLRFSISAKNVTEFHIESSISRLDSYASHSKCVNDEKLKQYCFC